MAQGTPNAAKKVLHCKCDETLHVLIFSKQSENLRFYLFICTLPFLAFGLFRATLMAILSHNDATAIGTGGSYLASLEHGFFLAQAHRTWEQPQHHVFSAGAMDFAANRLVKAPFPSDHPSYGDHTVA